MLYIRSPHSQPDETLYAALEEAQRLFVRSLESSVGKKAMHHLLKTRRLPADIVAQEGFGYIPRDRFFLTAHLVGKDIPLEAAADAGIILRSLGRAKRAFAEHVGREPESSEELTEFFFEHCANKQEFYYDYPLCHMADGSRRAGDWLTIPLRIRASDGQVRVGGFQYRSMRPTQVIGKQGRYMSPLRDSRLLSWSELIVGAAEAERDMRESGEVIICEGKMDQTAVLAAVSGLPEGQRPGVVALTGVAIRGASGSSPEERAGIFRQLAVGRAIFFLDADNAGWQAVLDAGPLLEALGTRVSVARIDIEGVKDPSELYASQGAGGILAVLKQARTRGLATHALEVLERLLQDDDRSGQVWRSQQKLDRLLPILRALPARARDLAVQRCVERTGIGRSVFEAGLSLRTDTRAHDRKASQRVSRR